MQQQQHDNFIGGHWVKGHSGHAENDRVDRLACAEADDQRRHHRL